MQVTQLGPYRAGGMADVYAAEVVGEVAGLDRGARVALKIVHPHLLEAPVFPATGLQPVLRGAEPTWRTRAGRSPAWR